MTTVWILLLLLLVGVAALLIKTVKRTAVDRAADVRDEMDAESRSLFAPIRRLTDEIEDVVQRHSDSAIMKVVGGEAVDEAKRIRDQIAKALSVRDDLKRTLRERSIAQSQVRQLQEKADASDIPAEKASLLSAIEARKLEMEHYGEVDQALAQIDSGVNQAQAALAEMKAKLLVKASSEKASLATDDTDLRETISRMKALSVSYDEAEQLIQP
jgi:hypothetical protein